MTLLFFLASCSLLKSHPTLKNQDKEVLLEKVQLIGEGRGRLTLGSSQYVFSYESVLNESNDWILAVEIPLHGEEVMILRDLTKKELADPKMESFEERIAEEFRRLKLNKVLTPEEFLKEFRSLVRFTLARKWGQKPVCAKELEELNCGFDGEQFIVSTSKEELLVAKNLKQGKKVLLVGKVFDEKKFERTDIYLYTSESNFQKSSSSLSLELFWKD